MSSKPIHPSLDANLILALQMTEARGDAAAVELLCDPPPAAVATGGDCRNNQRCRRGLAWNRVAFSNSSAVQEDGSPQSNVPYTQKGVRQTTDLPVHLHCSQTAISAGKYFRQRTHVSQVHRVSSNRNERFYKNGLAVYSESVWGSASEVE